MTFHSCYLTTSLIKRQKISKSILLYAPFRKTERKIIRKIGAECTLESILSSFLGADLFLQVSLAILG